MKAKYDEKVLKLVRDEGRPMHYSEISYRLHAPEPTINATCNRLARDKQLEKPRAGMFGPVGGSVPEQPWDMTPANHVQLEYLRHQTGDIADKVLRYLDGRDEIDRTMASQCINHLNIVRRTMGVKFKEYK